MKLSKRREMLGKEKLRENTVPNKKGGNSCLLVRQNTYTMSSMHVANACKCRI